MSDKSSALIHQQPIIFTPDLARMIGVNSAIVIQHLEFLLKVPKNGKDIEGMKWIYNTYEDWQADHFPFWSKTTIKRIFWQLEQAGFVSSCQPDGRQSRQKYYRISDAGHAFLTTKNLPIKLPNDPEETILAPSDCEETNLAPWEETILAPSCAGAIILTESPSSTGGGGDIKKKPPIQTKQAVELYNLGIALKNEWNKHDSLPTVSAITAVRSAAIKGAMKIDSFVDKWREAIRWAAQDDWHAGRVKARDPSHANWRFSFDDFLKEKFFVRIVERMSQVTPELPVEYIGMPKAYRQN